jgi:hypothetical protein
MESLRSIDVIDGRPSPSPEWMLGRIFDAGHMVEVVAQTDKTCTVKGTRFREGTEVGSMEFTFTWAMAERVKDRKGKSLTDKANYRNYPEAMLFWRAVAQLARQFFPDCTRGIKHIPEELGADQEWDVYGSLPDEADPGPEPETTIVDTETGEIIEDEGDDEIAEAEIVWNPTATGKADAVAIGEVSQHDTDGELWDVLVAKLGSYETWVEDRMEDIEAHLRYIFRAMEFLGIWQGDNVLREELVRQNHQHLSEFKKSGLQQFTRNMVMKAQVAIKEAPRG